MIEAIVITGNERYFILIMLVIALFQLIKWIIITHKSLVWMWRNQEEYHKRPTYYFIEYLKKLMR